MPHATGHKDRFSRVLDGLNWGIPEIEHMYQGAQFRGIKYAPTRNIIYAGDDIFGEVS